MSIAEQMIAPRAPPPEIAQRWSVAKTTGTVAMAFWLMVGVGLIYFLFSAWDPDKVARYGPKYLSGLGVTLTLVCISIVLGALVSIPVVAGRMSNSPAFSGVAYVYVYFFRGTPLIAQLFLLYYGLGEFRHLLEAVGLWWFFREPWNCAILAFTLNTAAYQAEILRGAIQSVPRGQIEGGQALGLSRPLIYRKIILPQAMIVALRPYGNEIILMIKGSAVVAIITVFDLFGETRRAYSRTLDFQTYIWAAIFYLLIVEILRNVWNWLERRLTRHLKRQTHSANTVSRIDLNKRNYIPILEQRNLLTEKPVVWVGDSRKRLMEFPKAVRVAVGYALSEAQNDRRANYVKPMKGLGSGVIESETWVR